MGQTVPTVETVVTDGPATVPSVLADVAFGTIVTLVQSQDDPRRRNHNVGAIPQVGVWWQGFIDRAREN